MPGVNKSAHQNQRNYCTSVADCRTEQTCGFLELARKVEFLSFLREIKGRTTLNYRKNIQGRQWNEIPKILRYVSRENVRKFSREI